MLIKLILYGLVLGLAAIGALCLKTNGLLGVLGI